MDGIIDISSCDMLDVPTVSSYSTLLFSLLHCELVIGCFLHNVTKRSNTSRLLFF